MGRWRWRLELCSYNPGNSQGNYKLGKAGKAGNPFQTTQGNRLSCRDQEGMKEISPGISLEGMMLKRKLQYFGHLMGRVDSLEKILMLGKIEGRRRRGPQRMTWLGGITDLMDVNLSMQSWDRRVRPRLV